MGFLVDPDYAGEFLDDFFDEFVGLVVWIGLEVEDQDVLTAKALAAWIYELADAQEGLNTDVVVLAFFSLFLGFFFFRFLLFVRFLNVFDFFLGFIVFLALLFIAEGLVVFFS